MRHSLTIPIHAHIEVHPEHPQPGSTIVLGFHGYAERAAVQMQRLRAIASSTGYCLCAPETFNFFYTKRGTVVGSWMTKEFREDAIEDCIRYVDLVIQYLVATFDCNPSPVLFGFSQGGALAYRYAVRGATTSQALIAVGCDMPPEVATDLSALPPTLLCHGTQDERVPQAVFDEACAQLRDSSIPFEHYLFEGPHAPNEECLSHIASFLERVSRGEGSAIR